MTVEVSPSLAARCRAAIEAHEIHVSACRYRAQGLVCSTCSDFQERAARAASILQTIVSPAAPADELVVADGVVSWSRTAA